MYVILQCVQSFCSAGMCEVSLISFGDQIALILRFFCWQSAKLNSFETRFWPVFFHISRRIHIKSKSCFYPVWNWMYVKFLCSECLFGIRKFLKYISNMIHTFRHTIRTNIFYCINCAAVFGQIMYVQKLHLQLHVIYIIIKNTSI